VKFAQVQVLLCLSRGGQGAAKSGETLTELVIAVMACGATENCSPIERATEEGEYNYEPVLLMQENECYLSRMEAKHLERPKPKGDEVG